MEKISPQSAGGKARAAKLTREQRLKIARQAITERWKGVPKSTKVNVSAKVDENVLNRALAKWDSNKSALIEKLLSDYAEA